MDMVTSNVQHSSVTASWRRERTFLEVVILLLYFEE